MGEEEDPDMRTAKDKVRDEFAERKKKTKDDEKIIIKPVDLSGRGKKDADDEEDEEEDLDMRTAKDKVRDEFAERKKKTKEDEKIIIKPADLSGRGKKDADDEEDEEEDPDMRTAKDKVRDEFAERKKKTKEDEKIIIKPADL